MFYELSPRRGATMGSLLPIPLTEIRAYLDEYEFEDRQIRQQAIHHIGQLDAAYIGHHVEKQKPAQSLDKKTNI